VLTPRCLHLAALNLMESCEQAIAKAKNEEKWLRGEGRFVMLGLVALHGRLLRNKGRDKSKNVASLACKHRGLRNVWCRNE